MGALFAILENFTKYIERIAYYVETLDCFSSGFGAL